MRALRYFKSHWNETRGDALDDWGTSWWHFEVAEDGYVERQVATYANGVCLTYDRGHVQDDFGALAEKLFGPEDLRELHALDAAEFEAIWSRARPLNRSGG